MRLIDADEIRKKAVPHTRGEHGYNANIRKWAVLVGDIDDAPTIDAVPVVCGQWKKIEVSYFTRRVGGLQPNKRIEYSHNECGKTVRKREPYCPNCGARMDGEA